MGTEDTCSVFCSRGSGSSLVDVCRTLGAWGKQEQNFRQIELSPALSLPSQAPQAKLWEHLPPPEAVFPRASPCAWTGGP